MPLICGTRYPKKETISAAIYAATEKIAYGRDPSLKDVIEVGLNSGTFAGELQYFGQDVKSIRQIKNRYRTDKYKIRNGQNHEYCN